VATRERERERESPEISSLIADRGSANDALRDIKGLGLVSAIVLG
jgi:hypothetical protein